MNPSTEDIVKAVKAVHAENIIILPNNKNIIMAAEQVADLVDENIIVIPAKTVPQGMVALLAFNPDSFSRGKSISDEGSSFSCENRTNYVCCT